MIYVLGKTGMLGRYIYSYLNKQGLSPIGLDRSTLDAGRIEDVRNFLEENINRGDWIINCMGVTNKRPDVSIQDMYVVNSVFPHLLDRICTRKNAYLIHPSTDCVFSGSEKSNHPNAEDDYGLSKSIGEFLPNSTVIRVSIIGEEERRKSNLLEWVRSQEGTTVKGYTNHYWNGITCLEYAKLITRLITTDTHWKGVKTFRSTYKGNFHVSKYELVQAINEIYSLRLTIIPVETPMSNDKAMDGEEIETDLYTQIKELKEYSFL